MTVHLISVYKWKSTKVLFVVSRPLACWCVDFVACWHEMHFCDRQTHHLIHPKLHETLPNAGPKQLVTQWLLKFGERFAVGAAPSRPFATGNMSGNELGTSLPTLHSYSFEQIPGLESPDSPHQVLSKWRQLYRLESKFIEKFTAASTNQGLSRQCLASGQEISVPQGKDIAR